MRACKKQAEELVSKMTVAEQASQLRYDAPAIPRLNIPAYNWWNEGLHGLARAGTATMFPQAIAMAATFDAALVQQMGEITATEARAMYNACSQAEDRDIYKGLTIWAPNINIFRDPRWGRGQETYGEDPYLTATLGKAMVVGLQQNDGTFLKTAACAKHFAVHSGPEAVRHTFDAKISPKDLEETYLPAFQALVEEAEVAGVMGAYNRVNGAPACANPFLMQKLKDWQFDGYFVSDCWAIRDFHTTHKITETATDSIALALKAGCHLNCGCTYVQILLALEEGKITEEDIRTACVQVMQTRFQLGMFEAQQPFSDIPITALSCPAHKSKSLAAAKRAMVLLRNEKQILPLSADSLQTIAVIGPNADSRAALFGNYNGTADHYVTFLEGIQRIFSGRVLYAEGCHLFHDRCAELAQPGDRYAEAVAVAKAADVVILCLGLDATLEGEEGDTGNEFASGDKADLLLPEPQRILLKKIATTGKPVILVTATGSAIQPEIQTDGWIQAWYPGSEGGTALAEILFGQCSPSGKLPVTFYADADKLPAFTDYRMQGRTYRYTQDNLLYPFGYGLTYGKIVCIDLQYANGFAIVIIENQGPLETEDVIQIYVQDNAACAVPFYSLCGFQRVALQAGEQQKVVVPLSKNTFTSVDEMGRRNVYGTVFTLYAGTSQPDPISQKLTKTIPVILTLTKEQLNL
ncbi:MAG: glycoside hydrolase family 3 C-terminal domain-containing protein [Oscillospiraceae bacterium]|nr:glycoside hydrolase family 3 C-terminal domain-containing protein [Oscillospiraceae bacterium]